MPATRRLWIASLIIIVAVSAIISQDYKHLILAQGRATSTPNINWIKDPIDLRVQSGPGYQYTEIGILQFGDWVQPLGRDISGDWILISYLHTQGWIPHEAVQWRMNTNALPLIEPDEFTPIPRPLYYNTPGGPTQTPNVSWVDAGQEGAFVRSGPGQGYLPLGSLFTGDAVDPVAHDLADDWVLIRFGDGYGWLRYDLAIWAEDILALPVVDRPDLTPSFTRIPSNLTYPVYPSRVPPTFTPSATLTITPLPTVTDTPTSTPTSTSTATSTATATVTDTPTNTPTDIPTNTPEPTDTPEPTATPEPSVTPTVPPSETPEPTFTPTETLTSTPEPTATEEPSATATEETSVDVAQLPTNTAEPTLAPSATPTPEPSDTPTPEPTEEPTAEPSATPITPTVTLTPPPTETLPPSATPSEMPSETPTKTLAPTLPATQTPLAVAANDNPGGGESGPGSTAPDDNSDGIPPVFWVLGVSALLAVSYITVFLYQTTKLARYRTGFVLTTCPICETGHLTPDVRHYRMIGIPRARRVIRCDTCRSVLREVSAKRWRYAVDGALNAELFGRYNGRVLSEDELRAISPDYRGLAFEDFESTDPPA